MLLRLDSIQDKAKDQQVCSRVQPTQSQATLAGAGRMPPPSPILQHLKETEAVDTFTLSAQRVHSQADMTQTEVPRQVRPQAVIEREDTSRAREVSLKRRQRPLAAVLCL